MISARRAPTEPVRRHPRARDAGARDGGTDAAPPDAGGSNLDDAGSAAQVTLERVDGAGPVVEGATITLRWTTSGAASCEASASPPAPGWSGALDATGGSADLVLEELGTYALSIRCVDAAGLDAAAEVRVTVIDYCESIAGDPLVRPEGFVEHLLTWEQAFYGHRYPSSGSPLAPMGSFTLRSGSDNGPPIAGRYLSIAFTPSTGVYRLGWLQIQFIPEHGYIVTPDGQTRVADNVYFTVSRCPGDFRLPDSASGDPALHQGCRKIRSAGAIFYSEASGFNVCPIEVGEPHYLNVLFADPRDGLTTTENTCGAGRDACEVMTRHELQTP